MSETRTVVLVGMSVALLSLALNASWFGWLLLLVPLGFLINGIANSV